MENLKKYFAQALLLSFVIKMLAVTPSFADMGIVFALGGLIALQTYLEKSTSVQEVKEFVNKQTEVINTMAVELHKVKNDMEGVKLKNGFINSGGLNKRVG